MDAILIANECVDVGKINKWVKWLKFCIMIVKFYVLINGSASGFFPSERELRQGDSLSPFVFFWNAPHYVSWNAFG